MYYVVLWFSLFFKQSNPKFPRVSLTWHLKLHHIWVLLPFLFTHGPLFTIQFIWVMFRTCLPFTVKISTWFLQKSGTQLPIHRSRSVPELIKDGSIRQIDSSSGVIRVVPITPRVADENLAALTIAPTIDAGSKTLQAVYCCLTLNFPLKVT